MENGFNAVRQLAARDHHAPPTSLALQTDICPQADHQPVGSAARMGFTKPQDITNMQFSQHGAIISLWVEAASQMV